MQQQLKMYRIVYKLGYKTRMHSAQDRDRRE